MVFWFIIEHTMLPIFFLVVLGYFLDKKFHLDVKTLSKLMFFLVIPSFIFTNIYTTQFPATSINIIAAIAVFMVICFIIANIVARIRHYDAAMLESCRNAFMFNNTGNLGVALIILVFSHEPFVVNGQTPYLAEAMVVQIIIFMIQSISLNTLGLYQAGRGRLTARDTLSVMFHMPLLYVLAAALIARYVGWDAKDFFLWPIMEMASKALLPLAMVSIGAQLSQTKIHWLDKDVWIVSILKMTALPLIGLAMIYIANAFRPGTFTAVSATVFLIYCAIPTAVNTALFAIEFDNSPVFQNGHADTGQADFIKRTDETINICAECHGVADEDPFYGNHGDDEETLHDRRQDVLVADHAAIEEAQARCHDEYQGGADEDPGRIACIDRPRIGSECCRRCHEQTREQHS